MGQPVRETSAGSWAAQRVNIDPGTTATIAAADTHRRVLSVINVGTVPVNLTAVASAGLANSFPLGVGAGYEFKHAQPVYAFLDAGEVTPGLVATLIESGES